MYSGSHFEILILLLFLKCVPWSVPRYVPRSVSLPWRQAFSLGRFRVPFAVPFAVTFGVPLLCRYQQLAPWAQRVRYRGAVSSQQRRRRRASSGGNGRLTEGGQCRARRVVPAASAGGLGGWWLERLAI